MVYRNEKNIKCPYCDWEDEESYMYLEMYEKHVNIKHECINCKKKFWLEIKTIDVYDSMPLNCEENGIEHRFTVKNIWSKTSKLVNNKWIALPDKECVYTKELECSVCKTKEKIVISKEEYNLIFGKWKESR